MKRPTKKEIKAAIDALKATTDGPGTPPEQPQGKPEPPKANRRIRKQGV